MPSASSSSSSSSRQLALSCLQMPVPRFALCCLVFLVAILVGRWRFSATIVTNEPALVLPTIECGNSTTTAHVTNFLQQHTIPLASVAHIQVEIMPPRFRIFGLIHSIAITFCTTCSIASIVSNNHRREWLLILASFVLLDFIGGWLASYQLAWTVHRKPFSFEVGSSVDARDAFVIDTPDADYVMRMAIETCELDAELLQYWSRTDSMNPRIYRLGLVWSETSKQLMLDRKNFHLLSIVPHCLFGLVWLVLLFIYPKSPTPPPASGLNAEANRCEC